MSIIKIRQVADSVIRNFFIPIVKIISLNLIAVWKVLFNIIRSDEVDIFTKAVLSSISISAVSALIGFITGFHDLFYGISVVSLSLLLVIAVAYRLFGLEERMNETHIRGARMMHGKELENYIKQYANGENLKIAEVPISHEIECLNFLVTGSPGTGKSLIIKNLMKQIRSRGGNDIVICADPNGDLMKTFFHEGDKILNPLDSRSENWSLLAEGVEEWEATRLARCVIPDSKRGGDDEWPDYAKSLITAVIQKLGSEATNGDLLDALTVWNADKLGELVVGTPAALFFQKGSEKMLSNIRSVMTPSLTPWQYLDRTGSRADFSIRQFLSDAVAAPQAEKPWLWMPYSSNQRSLLRPMLGAWLDLASTATMQLEPDSARRIWLIIDELPALRKISSLQETLAEGRKFGVACVAGLQALSMLRSNYGQEDASSLLACFQNVVTLRVTDFDTADYMSKALGEGEIERIKISTSESDNGNSTSTTTERRQGERVVMTADIQNLPKLSGFLNIAGDIPVCPITVKIVEYASKIEPFEAKKRARNALAMPGEAPPGFKLDFDETANTQANADIIDRRIGILMDRMGEDLAKLPAGEKAAASKKYMMLLAELETEKALMVAAETH